ncbi:hypothetical protein EMIT0324P_20562 [Pseudomonas chlororaphis]
MQPVAAAEPWRGSDRRRSRRKGGIPILQIGRVARFCGPCGADRSLAGARQRLQVSWAQSR